MNTHKLIHSILQRDELSRTLEESLTASICKYGKRQAVTVIAVLNFIHKLTNILFAVLTKYVEGIIGGHY